MAYAGDGRLVAAPEVRAYLDAVFTPGSRLGVRSDDPLTFVEVVEAARVASVRVPSGRLVVDTPWPGDEGAEPRELMVRIPAGSYGVDAAWTEAPYEFRGEQFSGREVAATRLCVREGAVAVWEMGLARGDDPDRLRQGDELGFNTDTSTGSFGDATAWPALTAPFRRFWEQRRTLPGTLVSRDTESVGGGEFEVVRDEAQGADLISFPATEGLSVAWLGRTQDGELSSIVVMGHTGMEALA
ncbi:DUF4241 domain-containing protein [Streptomyces sp. MUM 203J]|uniref:DUF4241 domain-containing protein n=1 Tax=Streptomyces sp. MUM 203J TaxID=2791990 RepID=UPI001F037F72|nr:DUF4241 domain-containing protein [Streptomyces sp. MUM 203J]MCH0538321.1 DUF4241 domain-containing protein [Streptomyces sp. MUM 203J]